MKRTETIGLRLAPEDLRRIDALARKAKLDRTSFMIRAALGPAGEDGPDAKRLDELEARVSG
jgi:uncharacterized protein (DUF1778 family)